MKKVVSLGVLAVLVSCSSTSSSRQVTDRMIGFDKTPLWANGSIAAYEEDELVIYVNTKEVDGDTRNDACMNMASMDALAGFSRHIQTAITTSAQLNETDAKSDPGYEALTAYLSQNKLSGTSIKERYWERFTAQTGAQAKDRDLKMHCAVKMGISKSVLKKQLNDILMGAQGNPEIREKLLNAQKDFLEKLEPAPAQ